jgi:hypothetical protein
VLDLGGGALERLADQEAVAEQEELQRLVDLPLFVELGEGGLPHERPLRIDQLQL